MKKGSRLFNVCWNGAAKIPLVIGSYSMEDHGIYIAHKLVHSIDIWLNNPRRSLESSGISAHLNIHRILMMDSATQLHAPQTKTKLELSLAQV